ncbi:MAG: winged helix-turn-helix transcriptional regulator [Paracoccaceae bacterium]
MKQVSFPVRTPGLRRSDCPINFGLEIFGDQWSLLILRDILIVKKRTFREFQASAEGIASNILSDRLKRLERCGLVARDKSPDDGRLAIYTATAAGHALLPVLIEMSYWGASHDRQTGAPDGFRVAYEADRDALLRTISGGYNPSPQDDPS